MSVLEQRIVVPSDMGNTIVLGSDNKYNVDINSLPDQIQGISLEGTEIVVTTLKGTHRRDLAPILPQLAADTFLKKVERTGGDIVFTVGAKDNDDNNNMFTINVSDLLPVKVNNTLVGDGTDGKELGVKVSTSTDSNLLKATDDGLYVSKADIEAIIPQVKPRNVKLTNASGNTVVGYIYDSEQ